MSDMSWGIVLGWWAAVLGGMFWRGWAEWRKRPAQKPEQTTHCWCKNCGNELISSDSFFEDTDLVRYVCVRCGLMTEWLFDAPAPLLINSFRPEALRPQEV